MLRLPDHWVWDSWLVDEGDRYHLFFLRASRALLDPDRRHLRASIGHAASTDLRSWTLLPDALVSADPPAWDDYATWTGSVVRGDEGRWHLFYTGVSQAERGLVQRIGVAVSDDLISWHRLGGDPLIEADPRWYEKLDRSAWIDEAWRDPHVFADPGGNGWHMLITARSPIGPADGRGIIGHARSGDLRHWEVGPPLTAPAGFGQLEVPQSYSIDGHTGLIFSCWPGRMAHTHRHVADVPPPGIWTAPGDSLTGPFDVSRATPVNAGSLYAGRLVRDRDGTLCLIGFRDVEDGVFIGEIADPVPVTVTPDGLVRRPTPAGP